MFLTWVLVGAAVVMLVLAFAYVWRNRPYRGPGADQEYLDGVDEQALQASRFVDGIHDMGGDIGTGL